MNERTRERLEDVQSDLEALRSQLAMMRCPKSVRPGVLSQKFNTKDTRDTKARRKTFVSLVSFVVKDLAAN